MKKIFLAGHNGMVGRSLYKNLSALNNTEIITASKKECDLRNQKQVEDFYQDHEIDEVYIAAAKVGGINANQSNLASFLYDNTMIEMNLINTAYQCRIRKLLFLGSSCIYPRNAPNPITEDSILCGELEKTNEGYALAKISGLKLCQYYNLEKNTDYRSLMPTNLYGPYDNFDLMSSHVLPALIVKFHNAKNNLDSAVEVWGDGSPMREFLFVEDLASASLKVMNATKDEYSNATRPFTDWLNVGSSEEISISDLSKLIASIVGFNGDIVFNKDMPNGTPRKLIDSSSIRKLGWIPRTDLMDGIKKTYSWYLENI